MTKKIFTMPRAGDLKRMAKQKERTAAQSLKEAFAKQSAEQKASEIIAQFLAEKELIDKRRRARRSSAVKPLSPPRQVVLKRNQIHLIVEIAPWMHKHEAAIVQIARQLFSERLPRPVQIQLRHAPSQILDPQEVLLAIATEARQHIRENPSTEMFTLIEWFSLITDFAKREVMRASICDDRGVMFVNWLSSKVSMNETGQHLPRLNGSVPTSDRCRTKDNKLINKRLQSAAIEFWGKIVDVVHSEKFT